MDLSFLGSQHEYDPRRNYSVTHSDRQERVNFERLRKERLQRAREQEVLEKPYKTRVS